MPTLYIYGPGSLSYTKQYFNQNLFRIGRKPDNDLVLPDKHVSGYHCKIEKTGETSFILEDLNSSNGTFLNGYLINTKTILKDGDVIKVGAYKIYFKLDTEEKTTAEFAKIRQQKDLIEEKLDNLDKTIYQLKKQKDFKSKKLSSTLDYIESSLSEAKRAYSRLKALYKSASMIISHINLEQRLQVILKIAIELMEGDRGYLMLYEDENEKELKVKVSYNIENTEDMGKPSMTIANKVIETGKPQKIDNIYDISDLQSQKSIMLQHIISAICAPLKFENKIIGVLYVDNVTRPYHYTDEDITIFEILVNQAAAAIENARLFEKIKIEERKRASLERYFSPQVIQEILSNENVLELKGVRKEISILFVDIRNFTNIAEEYDPKQVVDSLNEYFERMAKIIFKYNGVIDKFYGDGLMAFFGAPIETPFHFYNATLAACEMLKEVKNYRQFAKKNNLTPFFVGIGIHTGMATIGNIGSQEHMEYTAIGDSVNLAFRLSSIAGKSEIVISESVYNLLKTTDFSMEIITPLGERYIKGKLQPVKVFSIKEDQCFNL